MPDDNVKVVMIIGRGRSGSTILDNLLGEIDGFFSAGQLHDIWKRWFMGFKCGCGKPVIECELWASVIGQSLLDRSGDKVDPARALAWRNEVLRLRHTRRLAGRSPSRLSDWPALEGYAHVMSRVYQSIAAATGSKVIIDSSKLPAVAAFLQAVPGIRPYIVHLVRDPRAIAYSYQRTKLTVDRQMNREGSVESSLRYMYRHLASHAVARTYPNERFIRLRYEDFVAHPSETLERVAHLVGSHPTKLPVDDNGVATLRPNHTAAGNPSRFKVGPIQLRLDDEWITKQRTTDRLAASALTLPLLLHYGYPMFPHRANG